jgi:hypothetical protein
MLLHSWHAANRPCAAYSAFLPPCHCPGWSLCQLCADHDNTDSVEPPRHNANPRRALDHSVARNAQAIAAAPPTAARRAATSTLCVARLTAPPAPRPLTHVYHHPQLPVASLPRGPSPALVAHHTNTFPLPPRPRAHQCGRNCSGDSCATSCSGFDVRCTPHGPLLRPGP